MSRAANVTLTFTGDLTQLDAQYEAFVRKVQQPLKVNLSTDGATGPGVAGGSTTTFATGSVPGATPAAGGGPDSRVVAAMDRLTAALSRSNEPGSRRLATNDLGRLFGIELDETPTSAPARSAPRRSGGGGTWGPGTGFDRGIDRLLEDELSAVPGGGDSGRGRGRRRGLQAGRLITQALILHEAGALAMAAQQEGVEERLAVNAGGGVDLMRQLRAEQRFQTAVTSLPIVGQAAGFAAGFTGIGEGTERILQESQAQEAATNLRQRGYDYIRDSKLRDYINSYQGPRQRAEAQARVDDANATRTATQLRNEQVTANRAAGDYDTSGPDAFLAVAKKEIGRGYQQTLKDIAAQYEPAFKRLSAEIPALAQEQAGNFRAARLTRLLADVRESIEAETDPDRKDVMRQVGRGRIRAFTAQQSIDDTLVASQLGDTRAAYLAEASGDERGALVARQRARRTGALGPESDDPNRPRRAAALDAQDEAELRAYDLSQSYISAGLGADERVSGLQAQRRPLAATIEGIYSRGSNAADRFVDQGQDQNAMAELRITRNQLESLRNEILLGGQGVQVSAGVYGPGGTEANGQEDVIKALQDLGTKLDQLNTSINSLSQD